MRTQFDIGWNDMAYAINTYRVDCGEPLKDYVERCLLLAKSSSGYHKGCRAACNKFLSGGISQLAYRGDWNPSKVY